MTGLPVRPRASLMLSPRRAGAGPALGSLLLTRLGRLCPAQLRGTGAQPGCTRGGRRLPPSSRNKQLSQGIVTWPGESLSLLLAPLYSMTEQDGQRSQDTLMGRAHQESAPSFGTLSCAQGTAFVTPKGGRRGWEPKTDPPGSGHTSSGSESLNSHPSPVQLMNDWQDLSESNSRRNCHSWIGPLPGERAVTGFY